MFLLGRSSVWFSRDPEIGTQPAVTFIVTRTSSDRSRFCSRAGRCRPAPTVELRLHETWPAGRCRLPTRGSTEVPIAPAQEEKGDRERVDEPVVRECRPDGRPLVDDSCDLALTHHYDPSRARAGLECPGVGPRARRTPRHDPGLLSPPRYSGVLWAAVLGAGTAWRLDLHHGRLALARPPQTDKTRLAPPPR